MAMSTSVRSRKPWPRSTRHPRAPIKASGTARELLADWIMDVLNDPSPRRADIVVETRSIRRCRPRRNALVEELNQRARSSIRTGRDRRHDPQAQCGRSSAARITPQPYNRAVAPSATRALLQAVRLSDRHRARLGPDTVREDRPIAIKAGSRKNYSREYFGPVTLTSARHVAQHVSVRLTQNSDRPPSHGPPTGSHRLQSSKPTRRSAGDIGISVMELVSPIRLSPTGRKPPRRM